jgi:tetratricopeptide (TPR) repeat protein
VKTAVQPESTSINPSTTGRGTCVLFQLLFFALFSCSRPPADAPPAVPLFTDLGAHHHTVTTSSEDAQKYFDQGLRLVYGFNHDEAERAFREAVRLDPNCAMAWWGIAYVMGPNYNLPMIADRNKAALEAVSKAQTLAPMVSEEERAYIATIATRYSATETDRAKLDVAYSNAMRDLHMRYPNDNDAAVLFAESLMNLKPWQLWTPDGKPQEGTEEIVRVLETVLSRDPNHPGANHYYIHAIEASPNPEKGAASAERLKTLVPGAGHLVHMPAHIFIRTGDYQGAVEANAEAAKADEAYFERAKPEGVYPMMYYTHNFQFLSTAAAMVGQCKQAVESAGKAKDNIAHMANDPMAEYVLPWPLYAMVRCSQWDDIAAYQQPPDSTPATLAMWRYARGMAYVGKGQLDEARREREQLTAAIMQVPMDRMLNTNRAHDLLQIAAAVLDGRLASASGDRNVAIANWTKAIEIQDRLVYDEPPAWYYPVRESLGGEYLRAKRPAEAERVFRRDLEINRNNPRSLFGLREALRAQGKNADEVNAQFEKVWQNAEVQVSVETL